MVLGWKQPAFVGGSDITGYFVDYREVIDGVEGQWHEANVQSVSDRAYRVSVGPNQSFAQKTTRFKVKVPSLQQLELVDLSILGFLSQSFLKQSDFFTVSHLAKAFTQSRL